MTQDRLSVHAGPRVATGADGQCVAQARSGARVGMLALRLPCRTAFAGALPWLRVRATEMPCEDMATLRRHEHVSIRSIRVERRSVPPRE